MVDLSAELRELFLNEFEISNPREGEWTVSASWLDFECVGLDGVTRDEAIDEALAALAGLTRHHDRAIRAIESRLMHRWPAEDYSTLLGFLGLS